MSKDFQLESKYSPAGDQPEAIERLVEGLNDGEAGMTLLGVTGSGKTFTIANVIEQVQRPTLILAHNKTLAAQLYGEMKEFFPHNAVEYFVSYYDYYQPEAYVPSSDTFIEKDASVNEHIEQMRLSATKALLERHDTIIVATVSAIYGLGDPEAYFSMVLHISRGDRIEQRAILRRLAEMQYSRNDMELRRGTYRVRGEVIDIFPGDEDTQAVRVELFDDEIEAMDFDAAGNLFVATRDHRVWLLPASDDGVDASRQARVHVAGNGVPAIRAGPGPTTAVHRPRDLRAGPDGTVYLATDNDGVDDAPGETVFLRLGQYERYTP